MRREKWYYYAKSFYFPTSSFLHHELQKWTFSEHFPVYSYFHGFFAVVVVVFCIADIAYLLKTHYKINIIKFVILIWYSTEYIKRHQSEFYVYNFIFWFLHLLCIYNRTATLWSVPKNWRGIMCYLWHNSPGKIREKHKNVLIFINNCLWINVLKQRFCFSVLCLFFIWLPGNMFKMEARNPHIFTLWHLRMNFLT